MKNQSLIKTESVRSSKRKSSELVYMHIVCMFSIGMLSMLTMVAKADALLYESGFETNEGYSLGDLNQQQNWSILEGSAEVQDGLSHSGENSARVSNDSTVQNQVTAVGSKVVLRSYLYSTTNPTGSAINNGLNTNALVGIDLNASNELMAFDGDGAGHGIWRSTGFNPPPETWFEVEIVLDFDSKTWNLSANGNRLLTGLGFNNNSITAVNHFNLNTTNRGDYYLDDVTLNLETQQKDIPGDDDFIIGFEPEENFQTGNLDGQKNWVVKQGNAEIWREIVHSGVQAAQLQPISEVEYQHPEFHGNNTVSMYLQAHPTAAPTLPQENRSALIYYDETQGIMGFDGDGNGGGNWVASGVTPPPDTWFEITIQQDFENKKWDASIDGQTVFEDLGFYSNAVLTLSQVNINSSQEQDVVVDEFQLASITEDTNITGWDIY